MIIIDSIFRIENVSFHFFKNAIQNEISLNAVTSCWPCNSDFSFFIIVKEFKIFHALELYMPRKMCILIYKAEGLCCDCFKEMSLFLIVVLMIYGCKCTEVDYCDCHIFRILHFHLFYYMVNMVCYENGSLININHCLDKRIIKHTFKQTIEIFFSLSLRIYNYA